MSVDDSPWEPPLAGTEIAHLLGALERLRTTFRWKADGLDEAGLRVTIGASALTLGSLLSHLAFVEAICSRWKLSGDSPGEPWAAVDWDANPGWDFNTEGRSAEELYGLYDDAVAGARNAYEAALRGGGLDHVAHVADGEGRHASLRRLLFDLVEEYGRHTGHADLLREAVDGRVGEDPPPGWRPVSGRFSMPR